MGPSPLRRHLRSCGPRSAHCSAAPDCTAGRAASSSLSSPSCSATRTQDANASKPIAFAPPRTRACAVSQELMRALLMKVSRFFIHSTFWPSSGDTEDQRELKSNARQSRGNAFQHVLELCRGDMREAAAESVYAATARLGIRKLKRRELIHLVGRPYEETAARVGVVSFVRETRQALCNCRRSRDC